MDLLSYACQSTLVHPIPPIHKTEVRISTLIDNLAKEMETGYSNTKVTRNTALPGDCATWIPATLEDLSPQYQR